MSISICLATRNRNKILTETLRRFGTLSDELVREIIVCDDASSDNTTEILIEAARKDGRIRWTKTPYLLGLNHSQQTAWRMATSDFVMPLPYDDYSPNPEGMAKAVEVLSHEREALAILGANGPLLLSKDNPHPDLDEVVQLDMDALLNLLQRLLMPGILIVRRAALQRFIYTSEFGLALQWDGLGALAERGPLLHFGRSLASPPDHPLDDLPPFIPSEDYYNTDEHHLYLWDRRPFNPVVIERILSDVERLIFRKTIVYLKSGQTQPKQIVKLLLKRRIELYRVAAIVAEQEGHNSLAGRLLRRAMGWSGDASEHLEWMSRKAPHAVAEQIAILLKLLKISEPVRVEDNASCDNLASLLGGAPWNLDIERQSRAELEDTENTGQTLRLFAGKIPKKDSHLWFGVDDLMDGVRSAPTKPRSLFRWPFFRHDVP